MQRSASCLHSPTHCQKVSIASRALDGYAQVFPRALAEAIASAVVELCLEWFADERPKPVVRDLQREIDREHLIEGMARWILAEMRAHPAS